MIRASLFRGALVLLAAAVAPAHSQPGSPTLQQALDLFNAAKYQECFDQLSAYLQHEPASAPGYKILGMDEYMLGHPKEALAHLTRATELAPQDSESFYYLGRLRFSTDNPEAALAAFHQAIALDTSSVRARNHSGQALEALGRYKEAEEAYAAAIAEGEKQGKPSEWPFYNLGVLLLHDGRSAEAVTQLRKALGCNPRFSGAKVKLAMALSNQNHEPEAQTLLQEVLERDPGNAEAHYRLGVVLRKSGKQPEAREQFALFEKLRKP